jgi:hypothetical protein
MPILNPPTYFLHNGIVMICSSKTLLFLQKILLHSETLLPDGGGDILGDIEEAYVNVLLSIWLQVRNRKPKLVATVT